jgi:hypothetical protein
MGVGNPDRAPDPGSPLAEPRRRAAAERPEKRWTSRSARSRRGSCTSPATAAAGPRRRPMRNAGSPTEPPHPALTLGQALPALRAGRGPRNAQPVRAARLKRRYRSPTRRLACNAPPSPAVPAHPCFRNGAATTPFSERLYLTAAQTTIGREGGRSCPTFGTRQYTGSARQHGETRQQPCLTRATNETFVGRSLRGMTIWRTSLSGSRTDRASHGRTALVA